MRAVLLLLLCLPAAASEPRDPSHDLDGDGVVSDREERQSRREERRARRAERRALGPDGSPEDDGGSTTVEDAKRQAAAAGKAARMADAMKAMLPGADAGALGSGGSGAPAGSAARQPAPGAAPGDAGPAAGFSGAPPPSGSSGDPANPKSPADLLLAARGPYAPALAQAGLRLAPDGRGFLRLSDGKPATAEDLERLRAGVLSMPAALMRRPDFHQKVSPEHFAALQSGYREGRAPSVYRDVGATEKERDFVHSRSCEKLSGDCNEHVERSSYKKGEYVSPEDLERMYKGLEAELAGLERPQDEPGAESASPRRADDAAEEPLSTLPEAAATPEAKAAAAAKKSEEEAYAATPAFFHPSARRALAKTVAWLSPSAAASPYAAWRVLLSVALIGLGLAAALRRRG